MNTRVASILIASTGCVLALFIFEGGEMAPRLFARAYGDARQQMPELIPAPTRFAVEHLWIFIALLIATSAYLLARLKRRTEKSLEIVASALSAQGLIAWIAMFCFCYSGFEGMMCMHHDSEFEFRIFLSFAYGFFPITLLLIAAPALAVFIGQRKVQQKLTAPPPTE